jgi:hypothetical protein
MELVKHDIVDIICTISWTMIDKIISEKLKVSKNYVADFRKKNCLEDGSIILAYEQAPRRQGSPKYHDSAIMDSERLIQVASYVDVISMPQAALLQDIYWLFLCIPGPKLCMCPPVQNYELPLMTMMQQFVLLCTRVARPACGEAGRFFS